jgi:histidine triad (HIT) family protein
LLTQANEPAAGQEVFHFHMHIYPRWEGISFRFQLTPNYVSEEEKRATLEQIVASLEP